MNIGRIKLQKIMQVIIRTDASLEIGTGHVMRCLTLAYALQEKGAKVSFICRQHQGNLIEFIESKGYHVEQLPFNKNKLSDRTLFHSHWLGVTQKEDSLACKLILQKNNPDWLIVDHYALDIRWEKPLEPYYKKLMAIDDLADRQHQCDLLLDQNYYGNMDSRYSKLLNTQCKKLLSPKYSLLRKEFLDTRNNIRKRSGTITRILIFFSGSDPTNETTKALEAIKLLNNDKISIDVVVGLSNPFKDKVKKLCNELSNVNYHCQISNISEIMLKADLAIGAGGSTTWERCCLGLPSILVILSKNQELLTTELAETNAIINLGWADKVTPMIYKQTILNLTASKLIDMSEISMQLVDKKGIIRVVDAVLKMSIKINE